MHVWYHGEDCLVQVWYYGEDCLKETCMFDNWMFKKFRIKMTKRVDDLTFLKKCNDSGVLLHSLGSNSIIEVLIFLEFSPKPATQSCTWKSISSGTTLIAYHRDYTTSILNYPLLSSLIFGPVLNADLLSQPVSSLNLPLINKSIKFPIFIPSNISLIFQLVRLLSNPSPQ